MEDSLPIADTPEALTADWLTAALRSTGHLDGGRVTDAEARPLGTGQMCDSVRVTLTYDGDGDGDGAGPASLVAKLPAADPTSRGTALAMRSYEKEVRFYQELAPSLPVRTPAVYYADIDPATASFVLLLADVAPAEQGDQLVGCSPAAAEAALAELLGLHAPRWGDPTLAEIEWLYTDPEAAKQLMSMLMPAVWDGFRERYASELPDHVHRVGEVLFAHLGTYLTPAPDGRTIVHSDYRLDNLLFDPRDGSVTVVDWQTCGVGSAMHDVAYFVGAGLLEDDRRQVEDALVRRYHEQLLAAGVTGFGWDRCWDEYRMGSFAGLVMAVAASMMVERTDRGDQMFLTMAARHAQHAIDLDATGLLAGG